MTDVKSYLINYYLAQNNYFEKDKLNFALIYVHYTVHMLKNIVHIYEMYLTLPQR